jgi:hypothetical protein
MDVEVRAKPGHHRRGWRMDRGGPAGHSGGGGVVAPDLVEKENGIGLRRMVLGGGAMDMVRMVWGRWRGERGEYQRVCADKTSNLSGAAGGVSINNQWWTYYKEKITPIRNTTELLGQW